MNRYAALGFGQLGFPLAGLYLLGTLAFSVGCGARQASETQSTPVEFSSRQLPSSESAVSLAAPLESDVDAEGVAEPADEGSGPEHSGEKYERIIDNPFVRVENHPLSTFSIDVDTASYSKVRQYLMQYHQLPRPDAVRIEELLNYFQYDYSPPAETESVPFATHVDVAACPWNPQYRLARVAIQGRVIAQDVRPQSNLVLLIDSSGSMNEPNKLPLLKQGLGLLLRQLSANDRIALAAYAGGAGLVLDSTPASETETILRALDRLQAGGSTNGGKGLELAYAIARDHFIEGGTNRVLLCTDGDFNVGQSGTDQLVRMVEQQSQSGIELTVLGFGMGNLNDAMLEQISGRGNGNYAFIDTIQEAKKVLVQQLSGTLVTIAKDVKIQIEFNRAEVAAYRLIGYKNRVLESEDFADDTKDAGEIGAGHCVTALYEIIPSGVSTTDELQQVDALKYQQPPALSAAAESGELMTVKLRYKLPDQDASKLIEQVVRDSGAAFDQADQAFQFAAAVAGFGMLLRGSEYSGNWNYDTVSEVAMSSIGSDPHGLRREFVDLVTVARSLDDR
jgi:Ca-activated chloride channel family protein